MRMLPVAAAIVGALAFGNYYVSAQDEPTPKPTYTSEAMLRGIRAASAATALDVVNCTAPDTTQRAVNTTFTELDGRMYRCVVVLDRNFQRRGVAWTPVSPQP
jgi:hypothetical protein